MWGMQHLMHRLVPGEKSELPKEDRVPMSEGLKMFLSGYGYNVKPEMVSFTVANVSASPCVHAILHFRRPKPVIKQHSLYPGK